MIRLELRAGSPRSRATLNNWPRKRKTCGSVPPPPLVEAHAGKGPDQLALEVQDVSARVRSAQAQQGLLDRAVPHRLLVRLVERQTRHSVNVWNQASRVHGVSLVCIA